MNDYSRSLINLISVSVTLSPTQKQPNGPFQGHTSHYIESLVHRKETINQFNLTNLTFTFGLY